MALMHLSVVRGSLTTHCSRVMSALSQVVDAQAGATCQDCIAFATDRPLPRKKRKKVPKPELTMEAVVQLTLTVQKTIQAFTTDDYAHKRTVAIMALQALGWRIDVTSEEEGSDDK